MIDNMLPGSNFRYKDITLLISLTVIALILTFGALPDTNLLWRELQNSGHTFLFILVAILILLLLRDASKVFWRTPFKLYTATFSISLLIAVTIELMQLITHGDANKMDIVRDLAGIVVGLGLYASIDPELQTYGAKTGKRMRIGVVTLSFFVFTVSMFPLSFLSASYVQRGNAFPVVVDLTMNWMQPFLRLKNASIILSEGKKTKIDDEVLFTRVEFKHGNYPGISIIETFPDWSAYKALTITVYSKLSQPFNLVLRIHDDQHNYAYSDRFNTTLTINNGTNHFNILLEDIKKAPASREMNMMRIKEITLFSAQPVEILYFYLGKMRLK